MRSVVEGAAEKPPLRGGPSVTLPAAARHRLILTARGQGGSGEAVLHRAASISSRIRRTLSSRPTNTASPTR